MISNPYASPEHSSDLPLQKKRSGFRFIHLFVVFGIIAVLVALLLPATRRGSRPAAFRTQCGNNLKQIALALSNYESDYHSFPPAYTVDSDGKPLHSWRTLILPYLEQEKLYNTIDLSKPWHDSSNAEAFNTAPWVFRCPAANLPANSTTYLAIIAPNGCFRPSEPRQLSEITDKHSETLMVIEVSSEHAVHWMAPQDADEQRVLGFGPAGKPAHIGGTQAAFVDGTVRFLEAEMDASDRRAMISIAGNDN